MKTRKWTNLMVILLVITGCSGIRVSQDYDPNTRFGQLTTFAWTSPTQEKTGDPRIDNPLLDERIRAAVTQALTQKGYTLTTDRDPTFSVRYRYLLHQRLDSGGSGISFGVGGFGSHSGIGTGIGIGTGTGAALQEEGELVIDLMQGTSDTLLWRGSGIHPFKRYTDPSKATAAIDTLVEKILAPFPPDPS